MSGIVLVSNGGDIAEMRVVYAKNDEVRDEYMGYILLFTKCDEAEKLLISAKQDKTIKVGDG